VVSTTPLRVLVITDRDFKRLVERTPSIQGKLLRSVAERVAPETL
jgi:CRP-like cAMP-binding protein